MAINIFGPQLTQMHISDRKQELLDIAEQYASERDDWIGKNQFFYEDEIRYMRFLVPEGQRVLELGCGTGFLLSALNPSYGVGVDFSPAMVDVASKKHPELNFIVGDIEHPKTLEGLEGTFDYIVISDTIGYVDDIEKTLNNLHSLCSRDTKIIIVYFEKLWEPILKFFTLFKHRMPHGPENWLSTDDIADLLSLCDFDVIKTEWRQLAPARLFGIGRVFNRFVATLPFIRRFCLRNFIVARSLHDVETGPLSATVLVPCRNEVGNIESAVKRLPEFAKSQEILFVEGHSQDGTWEEIQRVIAAYPDKIIRGIQQDGKGKGDAVRKGFDEATGEVLMILDADLTVPPEDLPKFYSALVRGKGNYINGTRLVYPMEKKAMRALNFLANRSFSIIFSWLLNQRLTDTLCGTKVLTKEHYKKIATDRSYFGEFDPFGDFDLIFGASKQNLKLVEIPIRYAARTYGETQISRFRHGWMLLKMVVFAFKKLKAF